MKLTRSLLAALSCLADCDAWSRRRRTNPSKPVRLMVGFTPGSATDITARMFAQKFSEAWGIDAVAVENVPGAGGTVASARGWGKSPADGYTLSYPAGNGAITIAPSPARQAGLRADARFRADHDAS